jgi:hypothetical protein
MFPQYYPSQQTLGFSLDYERNMHTNFVAHPYIFFTMPILERI